MSPLHPNFPFRPKTFPLYYGWVIMVVSTIGTIFSAPGQTIGFSAFTDSVINALNLSRVQITTAYLVGTVVSGFLLPWGGKLYDRYGARLTFMLSAVMLGAILFFLSAIDTINYKLAFFFGIEKNTYFTIILLMVCFLILRFSGQGMMTMISRNMLGKWFNLRLGIVSGAMGVAVSGGFTGSVFILNYCVQSLGWKGAWVLLSITIGIGMAFFGWMFYRDNPVECDLPLDGFSGSKIHSSAKKTFTKQNDFTMKQAQRTVAFWTVTMALAIQALAITGITFHINSIGNHVGKTITESIAIFPPVTIISIITGVIVGWACSRIPLKYLIMVMLIFQIIGFWGMANYGALMGYCLAVVGLGISGGFFGPLSTVAIPHFFGLKHLGAISGKMTSSMVVASGLGPLILAWSLKLWESYDSAFYMFIIFPAILFFIAFKANDPEIEPVKE